MCTTQASLPELVHENTTAMEVTASETDIGTATSTAAASTKTETATGNNKTAGVPCADDDDWMPILFRDSIPKDAESNVDLSALVSFAEDGFGETERTAPAGKVIHAKTATDEAARRQGASPYARANRQQKRQSTAGEAQVLLSLWKI